ncbi:MAG TPA: hypothetical protein VH062_32805 [Polyangiaceae bacterium]|nr:hypothetical protein [Polyangiaceae bacterium]
MAVSLASALLLAGCFGGQTGQSDEVAGCTPQAVSTNDTSHGVSPAELGGAFAGRYTATLKWLAPVPADAGIPLVDDEVTLDVAYDGAAGTLCDSLTIDVDVTITTRSGVVVEHGTAQLGLLGASLDQAQLLFQGEGVTMTATLRRSSTGLAMSGTLESASAHKAEFPSGEAP